VTRRLHGRTVRGLAAVAALSVGACAAPAAVRSEPQPATPGAIKMPPAIAMPAVSRLEPRPPLPTGTDADADRVADTADDCPDSTTGRRVDAHGCALFDRVLEGVEFGTGDYRLGAEARRALDRLIADLQRHPTVRIRLDGHTDNRGTAVANLELSKQRVMSVARYLVTGGVAAERLKPYGYGESRPIASNGSAAGRERNRRIEIGLPEPAVPQPEPASETGLEPEPEPRS